MQITYDFSNFDPEAGSFSYPEDGTYTLKIVEDIVDQKPQERGGYTFLKLVFEVVDSAAAGQRFELHYLTGHPKVEVARIAMETLGRLFYGANNIRPPLNGLDTKDILNKPFRATLTTKEEQKKDGNGTFKSAKLTRIEPLGNEVITPAGNNAGNTPASAPWG